MLTSSQITQVTNLLNKTTLNDEFEIMFNNYKNDNKLSIVQFMDILKYLRYKSDNEKLELKHEAILDIIFDYEANNMYRVSIKGIKNINDFLNLVHQRSNHVLFSILLTQSEFLKNENFIYIRKQKDQNNIIDIDQYDIRIRKSSEKLLTDKDFQNLINMGINSSSKISFRYKNRLTLDLIDDSKHKLSIDLTTVQFNSNMNNIMSSPKGYEVEIDYCIKKENSKENIVDTILKEIETIKKIIEGTDILITKEENQLVIDAYKRIIAINEVINGSLYSMQPISAEVQHIVDKIPNFYSVTDKADGDKNQLFIFNKTIYLINNNLKVKKTKYKSELNNTILEGELIYIAEEKKYIFMAFDCLYYTNKDIKDFPPTDYVSNESFILPKNKRFQRNQKDMYQQNF